MSKSAVFKVLLVVAIPATGLTFAAARALAPHEPPRAVSRTSPTPAGRDVPIDLEFDEQPPTVNASAHQSNSGFAGTLGGVRADTLADGHLRRFASELSGNPAEMEADD